MEISYLGHSSFKLKGKDVTVVTDPFKPEFVGLKFPKVEANIVTVSHNHEDHNFTQVVEGAPFIIDFPGEYEVKGVSIFGYPSFHDAKSGAERGGNTIFLIEIDGINICHLGDLGGKLTDKLFEEISVADILLIPVGGLTTIGPVEAAEVVKQTEPLIVIPMHFKVEQMDESFAKFATVEQFLKEMGAENAEKLDKLSITKDKLPEETKVIVLERKN